VIGLVHPSARLVDGTTGASLEGAELAMRLTRIADEQKAWPEGVALLLAPLSVDAAVTYAGLFAAGRPVALIDPALPAETIDLLISRYRPAAVIRETAEVGSGAPVHPDLAVLLATSGSTGDPKLVRLSRAAILANAESIAVALDIDGNETAATTLPFFYSYGMSVLNSHLLRGARVVVTADGLISREFWGVVEREKVTSLAAVPYQYQMLKRLRFDPAKYPSLTTLTQAGGRLSTDLVADFHARMATTGGRMYVMYGQTEAGPRMATLPADRLGDKLGSAGIAIPGGRFEIDPHGEVLYHGPNVMMGYAESADDLVKPDELNGVLRTGDLGYLDDEGYLFITGRLKRIGKVFGVRVNLDDIERLAQGFGAVAAVSGDDKVVIFTEDGTKLREIATALGDQLKLHPSGFDVRAIDALPLLGSGKIDYRTLEAAR
jgi:acyl-CoA synthetase (AMP-forming)/AMP-acid ligase II